MMSVKDALTHRYGPLPLWGWGAVAILAYIVLEEFKKGKQSSSSSVSAAGTTTPPGDQTGPPVTVVAYPPVIVDGGPSQDGRPPTPTPTPIPTPTKPRPPSPPPAAAKPPPPPPPVSSTPTTPAQKGIWVPVGVWNSSSNPPWNSTLWGIAQHIYGDGNLYPIIQSFNHIANPRTIQPGQSIWVPMLPGKGWAMGTGKPTWAVNAPPPPGYTYSY